MTGLLCCWPDRDGYATRARTVARVDDDGTVWLFDGAEVVPIGVLLARFGVDPSAASVIPVDLLDRIERRILLRNGWRS